MAAPITLLYDLASSLRDIAADLLSDAGIPVSKAYVAEGDVAFDDCSALAVQYMRGFRGLPGAEITIASDCAKPRSALFYIWVIRCSAKVQDDGRVNTADMENAAAVRLTDAWVLQSGLSSLHSSLDCDCSDIAVGESVVTGPQGALVAVRQSVTIQLGTCGQGGS